MEGKQNIFQKGHLYLEGTSRLINDKYVFN
jgi:hypothetical protein